MQVIDRLPPSALATHFSAKGCCSWGEKNVRRFFLPTIGVDICLVSACILFHSLNSSAFTKVPVDQKQYIRSIRFLVF